MARAEDDLTAQVHSTGQDMLWVCHVFVGKPSDMQVTCRTATTATCADLRPACSAMTRHCCAANYCSKSRNAFLLTVSKLRRGLPVRFNRFLHEPEVHDSAWMVCICRCISDRDWARTFSVGSSFAKDLVKVLKGFAKSLSVTEGNSSKTWQDSSRS